MKLHRVNHVEGSSDPAQQTQVYARVQVLLNGHDDLLDEFRKPLFKLSRFVFRFLVVRWNRIGNIVDTNLSTYVWVNLEPYIYEAFVINSLNIKMSRNVLSSAFTSSNTTIMPHCMNPESPKKTFLSIFNKGFLSISCQRWMTNICEAKDRSQTQTTRILKANISHQDRTDLRLHHSITKWNNHQQWNLRDHSHLCRRIKICQVQWRLRVRPNKHHRQWQLRHLHQHQHRHRLVLPRVKKERIHPRQVEVQRKDFYRELHYTMPQNMQMHVIWNFSKKLKECSKAKPFIKTFWNVFRFIIKK